MYTLICQNDECGKTFSAKQPNAKYCCQWCKNRAETKRRRLRRKGHTTPVGQRFVAQEESAFSSPCNALNDPFGDYYDIPIVNRWKGEEAVNV